MKCDDLHVTEMEPIQRQEIVDIVDNNRNEHSNEQELDVNENISAEEGDANGEADGDDGVGAARAPRARVSKETVSWLIERFDVCF